MTTMHNAHTSSSLSLQKVFWIAVLLLAACALPFLVSNYRVFQFSMVLSYAIALVGLNILTGYSGQISLGHGAFLAIGAYTAAKGLAVDAENNSYKEYNGIATDAAGNIYVVGNSSATWAGPAGDPGWCRVSRSPSSRW